MWRLTLLFLLGLAHTLFYDGDILTLFGILGFALVMLYKCGTPLLITLCVLCLLQPVMLMDLLNHAGLADWWPPPPAGSIRTPRLRAPRGNSCTPTAAGDRRPCGT